MKKRIFLLISILETVEFTSDLKGVYNALTKEAASS